MKIKLKNGSSYNVANVTETKNGSVWFFNFVIIDDISAEQLDSEFVAENIAEILLTTDTTEKTISGYNHTDRMTIGYSNENVRTSIQLSKKIAAQEE